MLLELIEKYLKLFPEDRTNLEVLLGQLGNKENMADKTNYRGHIAPSGLIFSPDFKKVLLIYHPTFERWQQPGGHLEPDEAGPWVAAKRESIEETGVKIGREFGPENERIPLLIESHLVPTRPPKNEPEHYHHNFWYGYVAESEDLLLEDVVIKQAKWVLLGDVERPVIRKAIERAKPYLELKA